MLLSGRLSLLTLTALLALAGTPPALPDTTLDECDVMIEVLVNGETEWELSDGSVVVDAIVSNVSGELLELALEEPCPDDIVSFTGLGEGYDYYGSCAAGDCATSGERVLWTLEAEESRLDSQLKEVDAEIERLEAEDAELAEEIGKIEAELATLSSPAA